MKLSPRARHRTLPLLIAGLAAASLALSACSSGSSSGSSGSSASSTPVPGGTLRVQLSAQPNCLDPAVAFTGNERAISRQLVDSLVDMDPKTGKIEPWLASSWEINSAGTQYTFHLKSGVTFSDGTALDSSAIKSTFDFLEANLTSTSTRGAGYLRNYTGTDTPDAHTAVVNFSQANVSFLAGASTAVLGILSPGSTANSTTDRCAGKFVGSGPFTLADYVQGQSAKLVKRTGYNWPGATATHKGEAYLNEIDYQVVNVSNARDGALESKQADVALDIATVDVPALKAAGVTPKFGTQPGMPASFMLNTSRPGLNDEAVRKAMTIGFDRASAVKAVLGSYYSPAKSALTSNLPQFKDESSVMKFSASKAKSILDDAGWVAGSDGVRAKDGVKLSFAITYTSTFGAYYTQLLQLFQQQMKDIGIEITLKDGTQAAQLAVIPTHDFDIDITSLTDVDPDIIRSSAGLILDKASLDAAGITELFTTSASQVDTAARVKTWGTLQDDLVGGGYIIPFWEGGQFVGYGSNVQGLRMDFTSYLNFYDTSVSK